MARALTPQDARAVLSLVVQEATGQNISVNEINSSNFVSVGESVLASGTENVLNALSLVLGRTFMAVRPYNAKLSLINAIDTGMYTNRMRKISFYSALPANSGYFNTDLYTQHATGLDNGVNRVVSGSILPTGGLGTMWEQKQAVPLELNFAGSDVWDDWITIYEEQLKTAFRGENEFTSFLNGIMTEKYNDIESQKEAFNRMTILNYIAGLYDMNMAIDLKAEFNAKFGTNYTSAQLRTTYLKEFLEFFVSYVKNLSDRLTNRSASYHWSPLKTVNGVSYTLLRHTPKDRQRLMLYNPLFVDAEAQVKSGIFNPEYLSIDNYEGVTYWQNFANPAAIEVTPAIPNTSAPAQQTTGSKVSIDYVVGVMYDVDAMMIDYQLDRAYTTPVEARKGYRNMWFHFAKNSINDFTENGILLYMGNDA